MPEHAWSLLCSRTIIDKETNQVSIIDVVEGITVGLEAPLSTLDKPRIPLHFELVTLWNRSEPDTPEKAVGKYKLTGPKGEALTDQEIEIDLSQFKRFRSTLKAESLPLPSAGTFLFTVLLRGEDGDSWQKVGHAPLEVTIEVREPPKVGRKKGGRAAKSTAKT